MKEANNSNVIFVTRIFHKIVLNLRSHYDAGMVFSSNICKSSFKTKGNLTLHIESMHKGLVEKEAIQM